jgi:hypothetical protein
MPVTVEDFRKATEDLVYANIVEIFLIKHGELSATAGDNTISFTGDPYDTADEYAIGFFEALDVDEIDVRGELSIKDKTVNGFTVTTVRNCVIRWVTTRVSPKINFWT